MSKTLFIVSILVVLSQSLKLSEIGRNDWHIENIGELTFVQLVQNKLFYLTEIAIIKSKTFLLGRQSNGQG